MKGGKPGSYYQRHRERIRAKPRSEVQKEQSRKAGLKFRFGLTDEQYQARVLAQGGLCAICSRPPGKKNLSVDHNHTTGGLRGLLCSNCNTGIGMFHESPDALHRALTYLSYWEG